MPISNGHAYSIGAACIIRMYYSIPAAGVAIAKYPVSAKRRKSVGRIRKCNAGRQAAEHSLVGSEPWYRERIGISIVCKARYVRASGAIGHGQLDRKGTSLGVR